MSCNVWYKLEQEDGFTEIIYPLTTLGILSHQRYMIHTMYLTKFVNIPLNSFLRNILKSSRPRRSVSNSNKLKDQRSTRILVGMSTLNTNAVSVTH